MNCPEEFSHHSPIAMLLLWLQETALQIQSPPLLLSTRYGVRRRGIAPKKPLFARFPGASAGPSRTQGNKHVAFIVSKSSLIGGKTAVLIFAPFYCQEELKIKPHAPMKRNFEAQDNLFNIEVPLVSRLQSFMNAAVSKLGLAVALLLYPLFMDVLKSH